MPVWLTGVLGGLCFLIAAVSLGLLARRWWLLQSTGAYEAALLDPKGRWCSGVIAYTRQYLRWYRFVTISPQSSAAWERSSLQITSTRSAEPVDGAPMRGTVRIVEVASGHQRFTLALSEAGVVGLMSWLEAAPPSPLGELDG